MASDINGDRLGGSSIPEKTIGNGSAARATASAIGALAGLGGMTHGVGEALQGNGAPGGIVVNSWAAGPIATSLGGEPAMTIVPSMLATGILCILVSLALVVWAIAFVPRKRGGIILILLAVAMLLVGGGFAPPIIGALAGIAGTGIGARHDWWRKHVPVKVRSVLAGLWPPAFGASVLLGTFLVIGSVALVYLLGFDRPDAFVYGFLISIPLLALTIVTGIAFDLRASERRQSTGQE